MQDTAPAAVVAFPAGKGRGTRLDQKCLMEAVYGAGELPVAAGDARTKAAAARLQILGLLEVAEIDGEGAARRLRPSEAIRADLARPWRLARPRGGFALDDRLGA